MPQSRKSFKILETRKGIELAAMVDIIFLLLAYFLINSTLAKTPAIQIDLPQSSSAAYASDNAIDIHIQESGQIFLNGKAIDDADLGAHLKATIQKSSGNLPEVNIKGDRKTDYQRIIATIDLVQQAGLKKFNLTTLRY